VRSFTAFDAVDLYRLRRPIELAAVRLIIEGNRPLTGIEKAADAFVALPDAVTWDVVADHDIAFHRSVLAAAASPRLLRTFNSVGAELRLLIAQLCPVYRGANELAAEHAALLHALRAGKIRPALEAWQAHLGAGERFFLDLIKERVL